MSFCGFVTFSTSDNAVQAERAMRAWVSGTAASRDDHEWREVSDRGWMCAFSPIADPAHQARLMHDSRGTLVGDFPHAWAAEPHGAMGRARLARAPIAGLVDDVPVTEFALATWCSDTAALTLLRCPLGARAMFYVVEPGAWLAFGSLPEPLLAIPGVTGQIDEPALSSQIIGEDYFLQAPGATLFARLRRLPAAHGLRFARHGVSEEAYWRADSGPAQDFACDDPEVPATLRRLLQLAVRRRVAGIERIGTQVSGGLDSSAVTALAYAERDATARLFGYSVPLHDERGQPLVPDEERLAEALTAELSGLLPRTFPRNMARRTFSTFDPESLARPLPEMRFRAGPALSHMQSVRDDGCAVLLTGWGGDEMASARTRLHVVTMMAEGRWGLAARNLLPYDGGPGMPRALWRDVAKPLADGWGGRPHWTRDIDRRMRAVFAGKPPGRMLSTARWRGRSLSLRQHRLQALSAAGFVHLLEVHDWLGQRAGIAMSHPLLDRDLVAFCHRMPVEWVSDRGTKRRAFRGALAGILPGEHLDRAKGRVPLAPDPVLLRAHRARVGGVLRDLADSRTWLHDYVNLEALILERRDAGSPDRIDRIVNVVLAMAHVTRGSSA